MLRAPDAVVRRTTARRPLSIDGQRLDSRTQHALWVLERGQARPLHELEPARARDEYRRMRLAFDGPPLPLASVQDQRAQHGDQSFGVRIYRPRTGTEPMPALLYLHGGGGVIGDLDTHDSACRLLARSGDFVVVSAEYGLGPEHPFPAGTVGARAAWDWLCEHAAALHIDPSRLAVGGDSMGGNLAAGLCQQLRGAKGPAVRAQLLIYPSTDRTGQWPSMQKFEHGPLLTVALLRWFTQQYLADADLTDPRVSPLHADDLSELPTTLLVTAGFDPLRDEGQAYGKALREAGVDVHERCYESLIHGFVQMTGVVPAAHRATVRMAEGLRAIFDGGC